MTDTENPTPSTDSAAAPGGERIAKLLARAGIASRREVERMIADGRISLNGTRVKTPATIVTSTEGITVDGQPVRAPDATRVWLLHKPAGVVTTTRDPEGRQTVFEILPDSLPRVLTVGRLDLTTEGLLLLTNDGALARWLELPKTAIPRRYRVRVYGTVSEAALAPLRQGVTIDGVTYGAVEIEQDGAQVGANTWLTVTLREGKNREIRKLMAHVGLTVNRLIRTDYGPFSLGNLPRGGVAPVSDDQLRRLLPGFFGGEGAATPMAFTRSQTRSGKERKGWAKAKPKANRGKPNSRKKRFSEQ